MEEKLKKTIDEAIKEYDTIAGEFKNVYVKMTTNYAEKRDNYLAAFRVFLEAKEVKFDKTPTADELIALRSVYPKFDVSYEKFTGLDADAILENYATAKREISEISNKIQDFYATSDSYYINQFKTELDGIAAKCQELLE
jgi:hypothetical protein